MSSLFLTASLVILAAVSVRRIYSYFFHPFNGSFPPQVPSLLGGYDNGLRYVLNPCAFLARCQQRYGSVYRVSLGSWKVVVVSSGEAISSLLATSPQLLRSDIMHKEMFYVVSGAEGDYTRLHQILIRDLFPLLDRAFSQRSLGQTTQNFGLTLLSQVEKLTQNHNGPISLKQLTNQPIYSAINLVLLGNTFSAETYSDFQTLVDSVPYRFTRTLLWFGPSYFARMRLLRSLRDYLQEGEVVDCDDRFSRGFMKAFKDNNIQTWVGAQLVLSFLWGAHSNTMVNAFFTLSFLLGNPDALERVRKEIDAAVEKFGSLEALLQAGPDALDDPSFKLLTSAMMETLRLTGLLAGTRRANCDFNLKLGDGTTILIKEGECVFADIHAGHMDATIFTDPDIFVVDRFAQRPYRRKHMQTEEYPFHSFGGGKHACKGRWLAVYEIKALMIILLYSFDFNSAVEGSVNWCMPRAHPRSVGIVHTEDVILARLTPRRV